MKFYIAGYSGFDPDDMDYKKIGGDEDLFLLFPELKEVIHRYRIKNIDVRFSNGDRLRIYDIRKGGNRKPADPADTDYTHHSNAAVCLA